MEAVFDDGRGARQRAHIIHEEPNYFVAHLFSSNEVVVGHPKISIAVESQLRVIFGYDHRHKLHKFFDDKGNFSSYISGYFEDPKPIEQYLRTVKLIFPTE